MIAIESGRRNYSKEMAAKIDTDRGAGDISSPYEDS
jgi:hypothetical protein